jgi:hypothetical protein
MLEMKSEREADLGFDPPRFAPITDAEAEAIRGGVDVAAGLCGVVGFACGASGGIRLGLCVIVGVVSTGQIKIIGRG